MTPYTLTKTEPLQHDLLHLANALMTVPVAGRRALAREMIAQAKTTAARFGNAWGANIQSAALRHRLAVEGPNSPAHFYASLATEDGIAAFEIALAAFRDEVRAAEWVAA